jgi:ribosome-associated toxin RatA of RatAB toxin-antitoxin module
MAKAEIQEVVSADRDKLFQAIAKYEDYPQFVDGCEAVSVERKGAGKARATYKVNMMKEVNYTLDHTEDAAAGIVQWTMVSSDSFKLNNGRWELKSVGPGKTEVKYELELEFNFSVPGFILNKLIKGTLPSMVKSFVKRANNG